jgi:hypothetical protein
MQTALTTVQHIPAWHWSMMLVADAILAVVIIARASWFLTRNFRLAGIFVVTTYVIILVPLPAAVRRYKDVVPYPTVLSIATGLALMAVLLYVLCAAPLRRTATRSGRNEAAVAWAIIVAAIVLLPIWIRTIGSVPFLQLFGGTDVLNAAAAREEALDALSNGALKVAVGSLRNLYLMFAAGFIVSRAATARLADWRVLAKWRLIAGGVLLIAAVYALLTTERAILGELVIVSVVAWLISRRRSLSIRHIVGSAVVAITFPILYGVLVTSGGLSVALTGLRRRIFFLPDDVMVHYFIAFPRFHPFLDGAGVPKVGRLTGSGTFDLSGYIYSSYYKFNDSLTGIANGSFLGVGWANWGFVGVLVFCALTAIALVFAERLLSRLSWSSSAALRGVAVAQTALLTSSDINRSLLGFLPGFLDIVVVLLVAQKIDRRFSAPDRPPSPTDDGGPLPRRIQRHRPAASPV